MHRRILLVLALLTPLFACEDASGPDGRASTVTVRAYVDANGSGVFDAGDVAVSDAAVTLRAAGSDAVLNATTNAEGVATFSDVTPGSYSAEFAGAAPAGAVLATAASPTIVAPFDGGAASGEFRFVFEPGSISGVLFRDENGNGVFDAGTDVAAPGLLVELFAGVPLSGDAIAETNTSESGAFSFGGLRPGLYTVVLHPLPTMDILEGDTIPVNVTADVLLPMPLIFTGNLLQTIAEVRAQPDSVTVIFEGVATVSVGIFSTSTTGNQFNVQDGTGGVLLLNVPLEGGPQQGDSLRVVGMKDVSAGEVVIRNPAITVLGTGVVPAPVVRTPGQVAASDTTDPYQGMLVSVSNLTVAAVGTVSGTGGYNVTVYNAADTFTVRVGTAAVGIPSTYWEVGSVYNVTGLLASFNAPQLKVRSAADVTEGGSNLAIGTVRDLAFGDSAGTRFDTVTVEGVVHTAQGTFRTDNAFIQDATGGILLFNVPAGAGLAVGDSVRVTAAIDWFNGELELVRFSSTSPPVIIDLGTGATPVARTISGTQMLARDFEGQLVRLEDATVDSVGTPSGTGGYSVYVTAEDGAEVQVRIESNGIGIPSTNWVVGSSYDVTGALSHFRGTPQVKPRSAADVVAGDAAMPIGVVRLMAFADSAGTRFDTVKVEGVVHTAQGTFRTDNAFIQDASGGMLLFNVPATANLAVGDSVRVTAAIDWFNGELELVRFSSTSPPVYEDLGTGAVPTAQTITGAQMLSRAYEGRLVRIENAEADSVGTPSGSGAYTVWLNTTDGERVEVRIEKTEIGIPTTFWVVGSRYDVTGALSHFRGIPQLKPRSAADAVAR